MGHTVWVNIGKRPEMWRTVCVKVGPPHLIMPSWATDNKAEEWSAFVYVVKARTEAAVFETQISMAEYDTRSKISLAWIADGAIWEHTPVN